MVKWDFEDGLNGWAQSTAMDMGVEVDVMAGHLRGLMLPSARWNEAFVDSPELRVEIDPDERDFLVVRMRYLGQCKSATVLLERNSREPAVDPGMRVKRTKLFDPVRISFPVRHDSTNTHVYYVPVWQHMAGTIHRVRFHPCTTLPTGGSPAGGQSFHIDWVAFAKAPVITKVRGCIDKYYDSEQPTASMNCSDDRQKTNGFHESASFQCHEMQLPTASTFNCLRDGGQRIKVNGKHFGTADAIIQIDGVECTDVVHTVPETELECTLPPMPPTVMAAAPNTPSMVSVQNGMLHNLRDQVPALVYAAPVSARPTPVISNVAAHALDVNWVAPTDVWESMTITGYWVMWKQCSDTSFAPENAVVVGNVTSTTLINLERNTSYQVVVTALNENQWVREAWQTIDLYGRRKMMPHAVIGFDSPLSKCVSTLYYDFSFPSFSAKLLLNVSSMSAPLTAPTLGPSGEIGDQGHFGLYVNGHTNIQNCNASESCCDGYNISAGNALGARVGCEFVCSVVDNRVATYVNSLTTRTIATNALAAMPYSAKLVQPNGTTTQRQPPVKNPCGPALRLTASGPFLTGSAWYPRQMNVREGFDTSFTFRLSNPSTKCTSMDDVHTNCRSRGGDGFAFVIQNDGELALGSGGMELGYGGIKNAIAIEFDTWYNYEQRDNYENHISVHTGGNLGYVVANHSVSLGATTTIPDLTDGLHIVRITYTPQIDENWIFNEQFTTTTFAATFLDSGMWDFGLGMLSVYMNDMNSPILSVPVRIESSIELYHGRAWVGFTASTGANTWQAHDILSWSFRSLRIDANIA
ncbi:TPA: hypothetical protein N0F65_012414 [Lagenidium giganteum]|uniref:Fibronectin type-III domain-containing protein n=1 Tax=Lagenidium giganteum TaxID=4803 RepID=A0AAV2YM39_9STRA|nr:TPA: hypothetical protein N0F65_012414 [Lagenidium giganteum]